MEMTNERAIRTFHPRRGRMSNRHADAMAELWPRFGLSVPDGDRTPIDLAELFGRPAPERPGPAPERPGPGAERPGPGADGDTAPKVLEIGFGMGDATAAMAAADPKRDYLAIEVHTPGIGNLLALVGELGLTNVRVAHGDAMELAHRLAPESLDAIHVFFPDPWPKARHHKRRLIQPGNVALLRPLIRVGGVLHCATDWPEYAEAMRATLDGDPGLTPAAAGPATGRGSGRAETKFEQRGVRAGRPITDLVYRRT